MLAIETGYSATVKAILQHYRAIVYEIPHNLCSKATRSIFCGRHVHLLPFPLCVAPCFHHFCLSLGSEEERVPASVFRYYFYELWAVHYAPTALLMACDFRDIVFQRDPFVHHVGEWLPEFQLVLFQVCFLSSYSDATVSSHIVLTTRTPLPRCWQEFHPNMVINRCRFNRRVVQECYGDETLRTLGPRVIVSSGAAMGTRVRPPALPP